jgi:hypothetical protein
LAFISPLGRIDDELVFVHMIQHLLMGDLGALLIVLGLTGPLLQPLLANRWLGWLRHLAHPLVALPLWAIDLYVWHVPVLYQAATEHNSLHALQHSCFIGFGVLMWMPLVGPLPQPKWFGMPAKIGYLFGVRFAGIVLGNVFMWSNSVFYPHYAAGEAKWHISAITDQSLAGVIMMVEGTFVTLGVLAWLFLQWAHADGPAAAGGAGGEPTRPPPGRRPGLHGRCRPGRVAGGPLDPRLRRRPLTPAQPGAPPAGSVSGECRQRQPEVDREGGEPPRRAGVEPGAHSLAPTGVYRGLLHGDDRKGASRLAGPRRRRRRPQGRRGQHQAHGEPAGRGHEDARLPKGQGAA